MAGEPRDVSRMAALVSSGARTGNGRDLDFQYWYLTGNLGSAQTAANSKTMERLEARLLATGEPRDQGRVALFQGAMAHFRGDRPTATVQLRRALDRLPQSDLVNRMYAATFLGRQATIDGLDDIAQTMCDAATQLAGQLPADERWRNRRLDQDRADMCAIRGDMGSAVTMYGMILARLPETEPEVEVPIRCRLIAIYLERDDLAAAAAELTRVDELLDLVLVGFGHNPAGLRTRLLLADREHGYALGWRRYTALGRIRVMLASVDSRAGEEWALRYLGRAGQFPERRLFILHLGWRAANSQWWRIPSHGFRRNPGHR